MSQEGNILGAEHATSVFLIALVWTSAAVAPLANPLGTAPPASNFHETVFGVPISDPYRWMEDPAKQSAVTDCIKAASAATIADLAKQPERAAFATIVEQATGTDVRVSDTTSAGAKLFYRRQDPADRTAKLVVREAGQERVLLDPQAGKSEVSAIGNYSVAPDGSTVAVQVSVGGGEHFRPGNAAGKRELDFDSERKRLDRASRRICRNSRNDRAATRR